MVLDWKWLCINGLAKVQQVRSRLSTIIGDYLDFSCVTTGPTNQVVSAIINLVFSVGLVSFYGISGMFHVAHGQAPTPKPPCNNSSQQPHRSCAPRTN